MKQESNDPGPETRQKIVDDIMKKVAAKEPKPGRDEAELDELLKLRNAARDAVIKQITPIVEAAKMQNPSAPTYLHSTRGRATLLMQLQRMYIEELRKLSREEAIFLLALAWGEFTLNEFV